MRYGLLVLLLLSLCAHAQRNKPMYAVYQASEGVSNNTVLCMLKDSRGFTWMGTMEGLNRFDGHSFRHYFSGKNEPNSLNDNYIWDVLEFKPGKLLIATNNGISVLNTLTNNFENELVKFAPLKRNSYVGVSSLFMDKSGNVWINHSGELDVFDNDLQWKYRFTDLPWARSLKGIDIKLEEWQLDHKGRLWLPSTGMGLCIADLQNQLVLTPKNNPARYPFIGNFSIQSFYLHEANDIIWYGSMGGGLFKYEFGNGRLRQQMFGLPLEDERRNINTIVPDTKGHILCGGPAGIYLVDTGTLSYRIIKSFDRNQERTSAITALKGRNNAAWFGGEGLIKVCYGSPSLAQFYFTDFGIERLENVSPATACRDIISTGANNYFFSYGTQGLLQLDTKKNELTRHAIGGNAGKLTVVEENKILLSTSNGFKIFNALTKKVEDEARLNAAWQKNKISNNYYGQHCLFTDSKGNTWIAVSPVGIARYNSRTGDFLYIADYTKLVHGFFDTQYPIHRITEDSTGTIWFTSFHKGGILSYEPMHDKWKIRPAGKKQFNLLADKGINNLIPGGNNQLWLSSASSHGLMNYDTEKDSVYFITRQEGLLSDNIGTINREENGSLIIGTERGLNYYNPFTKEMSSQTFEGNGIDWLSLFVNYYDKNNQTVLFGLNDRVLVVSKNSASDAIIPREPVIDKFDKVGRQVTFDFTAVSYSDNPVLEYAYKLEGFDKEWNIARQTSSVKYTNLPPAAYVFLIKARNQAGAWSNIKRYKFSIESLFWETSWFWSLVITALGGLFVFIIAIRVKNIRKKAALQQKIAETEIQALRAQMNPHFIFNCVSAIDNLVQTNQKEKATIYLGRFAKLIRTVLDSLRYNTVPFEKDFESLKIYLQMEQFRCGNKFEFDLHASPELLHSDYRVPPMIVQPFVENAIQHGLLNKESGTRKLVVSAELDDDTIKYVIIDNGIGRAKAKELKSINKPEHKSLGIDISTERIHLHNKNGHNGVAITDLVQGDKPAGTRVQILIKADDKN